MALFSLAALPVSAAAGQPPCNVREAGARGDGVAADLPAIRKCLDSISANAYFPPGTYRAGTLALGRNTSLQLGDGATLWAEIQVEDATDVTITGAGRTHSRLRGSVMVHRAHRIRMRDFDQQGFDGQGYYDSSDVTISGIAIHQTPQRHGAGSAIWFSNCNDVSVSESEFASNDDVFCLKRSGHNIHIRDSVLAGRLAAAYKIGTETDGEFRNLSMTRCTILQSGRGAISIESVDGSRIDGVYISGIRMLDVAAPLFIRLGARDRFGKGVGSIRNVYVGDIDASGLESDDGVGSAISGLPDHPVENITLANFRASYRGGGAVDTARSTVAEYPSAYPEYDMFGTLPSYGLFLRHVKGILLRNVALQYAHPEARPAIIANDVDGLTIDGLSAKMEPGAGAAVRLADTRNVLVAKTGRSGSDDGFEIARLAATDPVWIDSNGNGRQDPGEPGFAGIAAALAAVRRGDFIRIRPGTHEIRLDELPLRVGVPDIHVESVEGPDRTILEVHGASYSSGKEHAIFYVTGDRFTLDGLTLRGGANLVVVENASGAIIRRCFFDGSKRNNVALLGARGATVSGNRSRGSGLGFLKISASRDCLIEDNLVFEEPAGIEAVDSLDNRFLRNRFHAPSWYALSLFHSDGNIVEGNLAEGGRLSGLQLRGSNRNQIRRNTLTGNKTEGILIDGNSRENIIRDNEIHGNRGGDICNESPEPADAAENWWGSAAGPQGAVEGKVISKPWLLAPPASKR